jgi:hypothetical protein
MARTELFPLLLLKKLVFNTRATGYLCLALLILVACVDVYIPKSSSVNYQYLVVDGILNTGGDTIRYTLSRTKLVASSDTITPESNARVSIEEENGTSYSMTGDGNGNYFLAPGKLDVSKNLRMHIFDNKGLEYASPYVAPVITPPIDSVSWKLTTLNGVYGPQIYVNTHDPSNAARYFLWRYEETWKYDSKFSSSLIRIGDSIAYRTPAQGITHCFMSELSTIVLISSSNALSQDIISEFPLAHIAQTSIKLKFRYSILVHQYALTKEAYEFWLEIQKNTENLGSIFGALPVQVTGNFTCITNPAIPVIGFFSATAEQDTRIFIDQSQLPTVNITDPYYDFCEEVFVPLSNALDPTSELYLDPVYQLITLLGYNLGTVACSDCRVHGGTTAVPPFW